MRGAVGITNVHISHAGIAGCDLRRVAFDARVEHRLDVVVAASHWAIRVVGQHKRNDYRVGINAGMHSRGQSLRDQRQALKIESAGSNLRSIQRRNVRCRQSTATGNQPLGVNSDFGVGAGIYTRVRQRDRDSSVRATVERCRAAGVPTEVDRTRGGEFDRRCSLTNTIAGTASGSR